MNRKQTMKTKKAKAAKSQIEKFKKAACELGCDENEPAFNANLRSIARQKPKPKKEEKTPDK